MKYQAFQIPWLRAGLILAVLFGFANCKTLYDTQGEFKDSLTRIKKGEGQKEVAIIMRDFNRIPQQFQDEAVENIDAVEGEVGQKSLMALVNDPRVRDNDVRSNIASRLIKRDEEGSTEALLVACQNRPELVNAEIIEYFGKKQYTPAIPLLKEQIDAGKFVPESVGALVAMADPTATLYLLTLAADREKPEALRVEMFQTVARLGAAQDENGAALREKAVPVYEDVLKRADEEPLAIVKLAVAGLERWGDKTKTLELLRDIYENSENDALRAEALLAMARLRGVTPDAIEKEYATAMVDMDAQMELMRRQQEPKTVVVEKKIEPKKVRKVVRKTKGYGSDYRKRLDRRLDGAFGADLSSEIQKTVNNALLSYASWSDKNPSTRFVLRSYSKHFGGDDAAQRERLKEGLNYPGSFSVIVKNVIAEYKTDELRAYAITQFFGGIKRWQAAILLDLVKSGKI